MLREVELVRVRKAGKQRLYGLDAHGLRPVHEWTGGFEQFWAIEGGQQTLGNLAPYVTETLRKGN